MGIMDTDTKLKIGMYSIASIIALGILACIYNYVIHPTYKCCKSICEDCCCCV